MDKEGENIMRKKAIILLLIFLTTLFPTFPVRAGDQSSPTIDDAVNFLYLSDAVLTPESELDLADDTLGKVQAPILRNALPDKVDTNPLLARIIHAKKMQRNDLDANCNLLAGQLKAEGKDCEAQQVRTYCKNSRNNINTTIHYLHKKRGDQRKLFTRLWHNIKRNASNFWYKIGPVGRNFLRSMGDEALEIVRSGGTLSGSVLKQMVKSYVKTQARARIKEVVYQGVQRLLLGQLAIAQAAGVDICDPDQSITDIEESEESDESPGAIPDGARWECQDIDGAVTEAKLNADTNPSVESINYEEEHWLVYDEEYQVLHYYYAYDFSQSFATTQVDGSLGDWAESSWSGKDEDTNVPLDEYGVFTVTLAYNEHRVDRNGSADVPRSMNIWGLIPPGDFQTAYICNFVALDLPTGLETLSPENFRQRCGIGKYYKCYLTK